MKHAKKRLVFFLLCVSFHWVMGGTTGKITGHVIDVKTGDPLIGANILLKGTTMGAAADVSGNFFILNIPPGRYDVEVSMIGYNKQIIKNVFVQIDLTTQVNAALESVVLEASEAVTVIASRPVVQKDLTSSESRISKDDIKVMPVLEMRDILQLQSGVTLDAGGGIHIRGGRATEVAYWIDGVPVTDSYNGGQSVTVENAAIQELQVISGTFNAEYGNAMSGIINIVTKEGASSYNGFFSTFIGDHFSSDKKLFPGIDKINPLSEKDLQLSLSGPAPLVSKLVRFYTNIRYNYTDGWLYGQSRFNIYGDTLRRVNYVPMNWRKTLNTNTKISISPMQSMKMRLSVMTSQEIYEDFDHELQYVPDGNIEKNNQGMNLNFGLTHTLSAKTFYDLNVSSYYKKFWMWKFKDANDSSYIDPNYWEHIKRVNPNFWFTDHAINTNRFKRRTDTQIAKLDVTSQITNIHLLKFGFELKLHHLFLDSYSIIDDPALKDTIFTPYIPKKDIEGKKFGEFGRTNGSNSPREFSVYAQDKIEFQNVIINLGLRWDYFDANALVPKDPHEPYIDNPRDPALDSLSLAEREKIWWKKTTPKKQISPRFGVAYPITDKGVIHFSFGHFFQIPQFELLYSNPGYKIPETSGIFGIFGNPDMKPQKTVMYELGIQQEIVTNTTVDMTAFYRDVRDWVSTGVPIDLGGGSSYITYVNKDYSNVRGIVLSVNKKYKDNYWFNLNYTYQIAEGSNSDPGDEFGAIQANRQPRIYIIPLNWDQTHTLNGSAFFGNEKGGATLIGRYGSGYPFTPSITVASRMGRNVSTQLETNSRRKPPMIEFDIKLHRNIRFSNIEVIFFLDIYNLFDTRSEINVWTNTGRANKNLEEPTSPEQIALYESPYRINTISQYFTHQEWYSEPRKIHFGVNFSW